MKYKLYLQIILLCIFCMKVSSGVKILAIIGADYQTHLYLYSAIFEHLLPDHNITVYLPKNLGYHHENITVRHIPSTSIKEKLKEMNAMENPCGINSFNLVNELELHNNVNELRRLCFDKEIQKLINSSEKYDLLFLPGYGSEPYFTLAHKLNIPVIQIYTSIVQPWTNTALKNSMSWAKDLDFTVHESSATLLGRVVRYIKTAYMNHLFFKRHAPAIDKAASEFMFNILSVEEIMKQRLVLVFVNTHTVLGYTKPSSPAVVEIGGVHIGNPSPLPPDLEEFISSAEHGVIYFSLGTTVMAETFSKDIIETFIRTFGRLKQRVLWKWKGELDNLPENIKVVTWVPQKDVLRHKNVRLFLTQGGMMSLLEASTFGVPVLAMPVIYDQHSNAAMAEKLGYGLSMDFCNFSEQRLYGNIMQMLTNPKYKEASHQISKVLQHQALHVVEKIKFWVDFVIKNRENSILRRFSTDESWLETIPADVFLVLATSFILCGTVLVYILCKIINIVICRHMRGSSRKIKRN